MSETFGASMFGAIIVAIFGGLLTFCAVTLYEILHVLKQFRDRRRTTGEPTERERSG